jgi:hypothetical protein
MNWIEIKKSITDSLLSRGLRDPNRRIGELDNIEELLKQHFPDFIKNPKEMFGKTDKNEFKSKFAKFKQNKKLNGAEDSIINEIYYRI